MYSDYYLCTFQSDEIAKTSSVLLAIKLKGTPGRIVTTLAIPFKPYDKLIDDYVESSDHPEIQMTADGIAVNSCRIENSMPVKQHEFDEFIHRKITIDRDPIYRENFSTNCEVWTAFVKFLEDKNK